MVVVHHSANEILIYSAGELAKRFGKEGSGPGGVARDFAPVHDRRRGPKLHDRWSDE
jgi:hypothetical protein